MSHAGGRGVNKKNIPGSNQPGWDEPPARPVPRGRRRGGTRSVRAGGAPPSYWNWRSSITLPNRLAAKTPRLMLTVGVSSRPVPHYSLAVGRVDSTSIGNVKGRGGQPSSIRRLPPIGAMAGGVFCGSTCDWKLPPRYFRERNGYGELMSAEITQGSTATTHGPS